MRRNGERIQYGEIGRLLLSAISAEDFPTMYTISSRLLQCCLLGFDSDVFFSSCVLRQRVVAARAECIGQLPTFNCVTEPMF